MREKIQIISGKAGKIITEYPLILVMALISALSFICMFSEDYRNAAENFPFLKMALVSSLGISLMFGLKMLSQRIGKDFILQLAGLAFLVFFYFLLPEKESDFTEVYAFLIIPSFLLSHLFVAFIPFLGRKIEIQFWQYNKNLFINSFLTLIFTGVLTGGVLLAILAVDQLFDFKFNSQYYSYTFYLLSIFGSCFIFLLFNEKGLQSLETKGDYPVVLKFFTQFILIPLLIIYAVILYIYSFKILISWELPRGWVSYLILAYSVVGILANLLVHPLKEQTQKSWVKNFSKIFYYTLVPLIILLFTAIFTRILEYGYTEPRYFVLLLAIWLTIVVLYFIFIPKSTIKFVPLSLFLMGVFALAFPYFNAFSVAKRSQKNELLKSLKENNLLQNNKLNFTLKVKSEVADEISNKLEFLAKREKIDFALPFFSKNIQKEITEAASEGNYYLVDQIVRKEFKNVTYAPEKTSIAQDANTTLILKTFSSDISGYQYLFKAYNYKRNSFKFEDNTVEITMPVSQFKSELNLKVNGKNYNLVPEFYQLFQKYPNRGEYTVDNLYIIKNIGNFEYKIMLDSIILVNPTDEEKQFVLNSESILILIKKK